MLQVLEAVPLWGSTLGVGGTFGAGGSTLGGFVWGSILGGVSRKPILGSACSNMSSGGSIGMGGDRGGQVCVKKNCPWCFWSSILGSGAAVVSQFGGWLLSLKILC